MRLLQQNFDFRLIKFLAIFYTVFEIIHILKNVYYFHYNNLPFPNFILGIFLMDWVVVILFMSYISINTRYLINKEIPWKRIIFLHFILSIFINFLLRILVELYLFWIGENTIEDLTVEKGFYKFMSTIDANFLIYFAMLFMIYSYYYFNQIKNTEAQKTVLKNKLLSTRLQMLTSQIQPHFLFNTLNAISSLVYSNQDKAQDTIADLSSFLRDVLYNSETNLTTLETELNTLDKYLNILNTRFDEDLIIEKLIDPKLLKYQIPSLLLQPIIENAIKHGYSPQNKKIKILIDIFRKSNCIIFNIENNGKLLEDPKSVFKSGVGLSNMEERLKTIYGEKDFQFIMENLENEKGVRCLIKIPIGL